MLKANLSAQAIIAAIRKLGDAVKSFKNNIMGGIESAAGFGRKTSAMSEKNRNLFYIGSSKVQCSCENDGSRCRNIYFCDTQNPLNR